MKTKEKKRFPELVFAAILFAFIIVIGLSGSFFKIEAAGGSSTDVSKCPHCGGTNFTYNYVIEQPTCQKRGKTATVCSNCKWVKVATETPKNTHQYSELISDTATCKAEGKKVYRCKWCTLTKEETSPKKSHTWGANIHQAPTCIASGRDYSKCTVCGAESSSTPIPPTGGHSYTVFDHTDVVATCKNKGSDVYRCSTPGCTATIAKETPALNHVFQTVIEQPTCGTPGSESLKCKLCGGNSGSGKDLPPTGQHTWVLTSKASSTCTEHGYEFYTCSVCKQTKKIMIDLIEHNYVPVTTKQPTKSENGTLSYMCSHCDAPLTTKTLYLISYNGNGAVSGTTPADQIKVSGSTLTLSADTPKRDGYRFKGWGTTTSEATYQPGDPYDKEARMNLYAIWEPNQYTIEFDINGGIGSNFTRTIAYGSTYSKVDKPSRTGYTFAGWYTAKTGGSQITETTIMSTAKDHTVYAHWTTNRYTVTFDKNGGSGSNITRSIAFGSTYGKVDNPIRSGYTFKGWYTAKTGGSQVTETTLMTTAADHTVYARWTATGSASGGSSSCSHPYMSSVARVAPDCTHDGYELLRCSRCGMTVQRSIKANGHDFYTEVVVQPTCVNDGYSVTKCRKCGVVSQTRTLAKVPSHTFTTTRVEPTGSQDGYEKVFCEKCGLIKSNKVLSLCGVILDPQNGKTNMTVSAIQGEEYGDILPTVSKTGYNFKGWYTAKTGGTKITSTSIVPSSTVVQLYARWSAKTYTVTFDANGGTGGPTSMKKTYGTASVIPEEVPTLPGYECIGWADSLADAKAKKVSGRPGEYFTRNKKMTLYAVWERYDFFSHNERFKKTSKIQVPYNSKTEEFDKKIEPKDYMALYNKRSYMYNTKNLSDMEYIEDIWDRSEYLREISMVGDAFEATGMLNRYFYGNGERYIYDARRFVVGGSGVAPDRYNNEINAIMREMEKTLLPGEEITFTDKDAVKNPITFMGVQNGWVDDFLELNNTFAIKEGNIGISATGFRTEDGVFHLDYYYFVQDYYDFYYPKDYKRGDKTSQADNYLLGIYVDELAYLAAFELVHPYETCGVYHVVVNWYPGQVVDIQLQGGALIEDGVIAQVINMGYSEEDLFK